MELVAQEVKTIDVVFAKEISDGKESVVGIFMKPEKGVYTIFDGCHADVSLEYLKKNCFLITEKFAHQYKGLERQLSNDYGYNLNVVNSRVKHSQKFSLFF